MAETTSMSVTAPSMVGGSVAGRPNKSAVMSRPAARAVSTPATPDGLAIDESGRIFVCAEPPGVQVFDKTGKFLGSIPSPRSYNSVGFAGPGKKYLYGVGHGAIDAQGTPHPGSPAKTIYRIRTLTEGPRGRVK